MSELKKGSERKFTLRMKPINGVHLSQCSLRVEVFAFANKVIPIDDSYIYKKDDDTIKIIIVSKVAEELSAIDFKVRLYVGIPDGDFPDKMKNQIYELSSR